MQQANPLLRTVPFGLDNIAELPQIGGSATQVSRPSAPNKSADDGRTMHLMRQGSESNRTKILLPTTSLASLGQLITPALEGRDGACGYPTLPAPTSSGAGADPLARKWHPESGGAVATL
jgi:hypothetical protein